MRARQPLTSDALSSEDLQPKFELLESLLTLQIEQAMAQQTLRFKEQCTQELEKYRLQRQ
jgi:hypothetical protein